MASRLLGLWLGVCRETPLKGTLHSFDQPLNVLDDNPSSTFVQQPSGQKTIFWIDAPGHGYTLATAEPWYFKLVVSPGAKLDTTNSKAALGTASTNF
jgi:hypothetical protein